MAIEILEDWHAHQSTSTAPPCDEKCQEQDMKDAIYLGKWTIAVTLIVVLAFKCLSYLLGRIFNWRDE